LPAIVYEPADGKSPCSGKKICSGSVIICSGKPRGLTGCGVGGMAPSYGVVGDLENHPSLSFTSLTRLPSCSRMRSSSPGRVCLAERMTCPSSARLTMA